MFLKSSAKSTAFCMREKRFKKRNERHNFCVFDVSKKVKMQMKTRKKRVFMTKKWFT